MAKRAKNLLGPDFRKLQPKLRMVANGSQEVNEIRSDFSSSIRVVQDKELAKAIPSLEFVRLARPAALRKGKLAAITSKTEANVFIETTEAPAGAGADRRQRKVHEVVEVTGVTASRENLSTATVPLDQLPGLLSNPAVARVELGEPLKAPTPVITAEQARAPSENLRRFGRNGGKGVLMGIIDVQGFDFAHPDFLEPSGAGTRFVGIWDQGGGNRPAPAPFGYGSEIRKQHMDAAVQESANWGLPAQELEPQSQIVKGSHGTHVASIAAGNRGVCRNAFLAGVLISVPGEDLDRRKSFYDSTRIAHAVEYLLNLAEELRQQRGLDQLPVSINISLGTNGHAHDGSSAVSRWLDSALATPGRSICVAAGNAGQEAPESEEDIGYVMGRIHTSGRIPARGLTNDIEWLVVGDGVVDISENELEIWYSPADRFAVSIKPPDGDWIGPIQPGQFIENRQMPDRSFLSVYNELYYPANGANYIAIYLSPFFSPEAIVGVTAGRWTVRLHGVEVRDGNYHSWIERDDPRPLGPIGSREAWCFPSFFSERSNVDHSSVSSLACGQWVISVANLDEARQTINISSSQGPTRDGRFKPDVAAPGTEIVAANGFNFDDERLWVAMTGTSMASPFVAGVSGLMLAEQPRLTAAQIGGIIQRTSRPLPGADFRWRNDAGFGVIDPDACLAEARSINQRENVT